MFHHVVLANDDEESVADDDAPLCVSARTNLGARCSMLNARLDENASTTPSIRARVPSARLAVFQLHIPPPPVAALLPIANADVILQDVWRSPWEKSSEVEKSIHYIPRNVCRKIGRSTLSR
eukprot:scaffold363_cov216-Skeletonema_marinoi.AAC.7